MPEMSEPGSAFMRVEWFGKNEALNHTKTQWHTGWAEKVGDRQIDKIVLRRTVQDHVLPLGAAVSFTYPMAQSRFLETDYFVMLFGKRRHPRQFSSPRFCCNRRISAV